MKYRKWLYFGLIAALMLTGCKQKDDQPQEELSEVSQESEDSLVDDGKETETGFVGEGQPEAVLQDLTGSETYQTGQPISITKDDVVLYELTIDDIVYTDQRDEHAADPGNVILVTYTYKNLSEEALLIDDMSFQMTLSDEETLLDVYYLPDIQVPEPVEMDHTCTAQIAYAVSEQVDSVVLIYHDIMDAEIVPVKFVSDHLK